jgi:hypothetical protein
MKKVKCVDGGVKGGPGRARPRDLARPGGCPEARRDGGRHGFSSAAAAAPAEGPVFSHFWHVEDSVGGRRTAKWRAGFGMG